MTHISFEWQLIYNNDHCSTRRAKVIGGWIIKNSSWGNGTDYEDGPMCESMVFVTDPFHEWTI